MLKSLNWSLNDTKLYFAVLLLLFISKGGSLAIAYAIDDYSFAVNGTNDLNFLLSQGRLISFVILKLFDKVNLGVITSSFSLTILLFFIQSFFAVSLARLFGYKSLKFTILFLGISFLHPYSAELLTFKGLPIALIFVFFTLIVITESFANFPENIKTNFISSLLLFSSLGVYQSVLNIILVLITGLVFSGVCKLSFFNFREIMQNREIKISLRLIKLTLISTLFYFVINKLILNFLNVNLATRATFINLDELPNRIMQIILLSRDIFLRGDVLVPTIVKIPLLVLLGFIFVYFCYTLLLKRASWVFFLLIFVGVILLPFLIAGIIVFFKDWWPVPRVVSHVSILLGLLFLVFANEYLFNMLSITRKLFFITLFLVNSYFVLINNQIFYEQILLNKWDLNFANRIVSRLEEHEEFYSIRAVYVDGGSWGYPLGIRTVQGDMNISARFPEWSRVHLLSVASGYSFKTASQDDIALVKNKYLKMKTWPDKESVDIVNGIAIVKLQ